MLRGQQPLVDATLSETGQALAAALCGAVDRAEALGSEHHAGRAAKADPHEPGRYQEVDLDSLELVRPRSVGVEHAALSAMRQCGFEDKLARSA